MTASAGLSSPEALNQHLWGICDVLRRSNCVSALQYVPELTWMLFLRILDEREAREEEEAAMVGDDFSPAIPFPYRWRDWATPEGAKRRELTDRHGGFLAFVNGDLIPILRGLRDRHDATDRQRVVGETFRNIERTRVASERVLMDVLDQVDALHDRGFDDTHYFPLSQVYEGLLLRMGEKGNDGGQFFTPREIIRAMVRIIDPRLGESIYDPCSGTGGFLAESFDHMMAKLGEMGGTAEDVRRLRTASFWGREKEDTVFPIALANLVLHGIDRPGLWHGNTLSGDAQFGALFEGAPAAFDVILTNPPFGSKESVGVQQKFSYRTSATEVLFLQHVIESLAPGGRCGIVLPEGVLFRTNENAFVQTKRKLLNECDLECIVSLPPGVFVSAGAGVKTNLLFFTKGRSTERIWYYDLSDEKVGKRNPFTLTRFGDFFELYRTKADSARSWSVSREAIEASGFDLKAVNPNARFVEDERTSWDLLMEIESRGKDIDAAVHELKRLLASPSG